MEVLVNGKPVQEYLHKGEIFIEGKEGTEFSLRFRNRTSKRALFVPTIDGLSIMDGKEASYDSSGYIVNAYSSDTIDGWRTSDSEVARFFFSKVKDSYAAQSDKGGNVGVIGCAVFKEKEPKVQIEIHTIKQYIPTPLYPFNPPWIPEWNRPGIMFLSSSGNIGSLNAGNAGTNQAVAYNCSSNVGSAMNMSNMVASSLGTGFGETKHSEVRSVGFERESSPTQLFVIRYNTRRNLEEIGVEFKRVTTVSASPFPNEDRYCKPPRRD